MGDQLVGVLPVIVTPHPSLGQFGPTLRTPADAHTPSGDVLLALDHAGSAFRALLGEVSRQVPHHLGLDLKAVRKSSPVWAALDDGLKGFAMHCGLVSLYSRLQVEGDCSTYFAGLGKMRRNLRIGRQRLESRGAVSVEMRTGSSAGADFLPEFLALEASGWKGRNCTAIANDSNITAFYTTLVRNLATQGQLEWHIVRVESRPVAAQIGVRCGASLMLPKYAFDEDFAECTPGHLLMEAVIQEAFARPELVELNPMSDSDAHRLWHMPREAYVDVHLVRRRVLAALFQRPRIGLRSMYQAYVRPWIPAAVKDARRKFKRRGDRKPRRAARKDASFG
jgi:hypothetical protein